MNTGSLSHQLSEKEIQTLIKLGAGESISFNPSETLVSLFRAQAAKTPDNIAVVFKDQQLTYRELDDLTDHLAAYLINKYHVQPEEAIGVMIERSELMAVYPLAIMKAGGAYMPLDFNFPEERLRYMCEDAEVRLILSEDDRVHQAMPSFQGEVFVSHTLEELPGCGCQLPEPNHTQRFVILFTSGSTGRPKGVVLEHHNIVNLCLWYIKEAAITHEDRLLAFSNFGFDTHMSDIYPALFTGARVYILPSDIRMDLEAVNHYMVKNGITIAFLTTQLGHLFASTMSNSSLRLLMVAGEKLMPLKTPTYTVMNAYGPTECHISTFYNITEDYDSAIIGRPIDNHQLYIVDSNLHMVPRGIAGELIIGGEGVARGYLHPTEKDAEKFMTYNGKRAYRTGDLCRWNEDGQLEFLGRLDQQVKLRGFRIELGEIESQALKYDGICQAVATVYDNQLLCLYYVLNGEARILGRAKRQGRADSEELKEFLSKTLPEYMIPALYIPLDELPLTPNGKVDRKRLPAPDIISDTEFVAPEGETEEKVAAVFAEVLNISEPISALDDFFYLGGDSIKAIRIVSRLRSEGFVMMVNEMMQLKTVRNIAKACLHETEMYITQEVVTGEANLTPIQHAFFLLNLPKPEDYNWAIALKAQEPIDPVLLRKALEILAIHHDILRAVVRDRKLNIRDIDDRPLVGFCKPEDLNTFDLQNGPLFKAAWSHDDEGDILLLECHHFICDGVSWRIITEDLNTAYRQLLEGKPVKLPPKTHSFAHYTQALRRYRDSNLLMMEKPYWQEIQRRMKQMELAEIRKHRQGKKKMIVSLDGEVPRQLLTTANRTYNTDINDLLITALCQAYTQQTGKTNVAIRMEGHGREPIHEPLVTDRTVGWFTSAYPLLVEGISGDMRHDIKLVKESFRAIPNKGLGYGILQYIESNKGDESLRTDLMPLIGFNYLGQMEENRRSDFFALAPDVLMEHFEQMGENRRSDYSALAIDGLMGLTVAPENDDTPPMDINCIMDKGTFYVNLTYYTELWTDEQAQTFGEAFIKQLEALVSHTVSMEHPVRDMKYREDDSAPRGHFFGPLQRQYYEWGNEIFEGYGVHGDVFVHLGKETDPVKLAQAVACVIKAHPALDARLIEVEEGTFRWFCDEDGLKDFSITPEYVTRAAYSELQGKLRKSMNHLGDRMFNIRIFIITEEDGTESCDLYVDFLHTIIDEQSQRIFLDDVNAAYEGRELKKETFSILDYYDQIEKEVSTDRYRSEVEWNRRFAVSFTDKIGELKGDLSCGDENETLYIFEKLDIAPEIVENYAAACKVTVGSLLSAAYGLMQASYNGEHSAVTLTLYNGRDDARYEHTMGTIYRHLPLCVRFDDDMTAQDFVRATQENILRCRSHLIYEPDPVPMITAFSYQGEDLPEPFPFCSGLASYEETEDYEEEIFDFFVHKRQDGFYVELTYNTLAYSKTFIDRFIKDYTMVLRSLTTGVRPADIRISNCAFDKSSQQKG